METLQELADTLQSFDEAQALRLARDAANPFDRVKAEAGYDSAKALAAALSAADQFDDVWAILRFHHRMGGRELSGWLCDGPVFGLWISGEPGLEVVDFDDLRDRADAWLNRQA